MPRALASGPTPTPSRVRLTRRGRLLLVAVVVALLLTGFSLGRVSSLAASAATTGRAPATVTVQPGETLWQLAARVAPHADRRLVVAQIERLNGLGSSQVVAGERLLLPHVS